MITVEDGDLVFLVVILNLQTIGVANILQVWHLSVISSNLQAR